MFIGHFAVGMAAKKLQPTLSLGILFLAAQLLDLLWPTFLLLGVEHVIISPGISKVTPLDFVDYPVSHSLLMVTMWSLLFAAGSFLMTKDRLTAIILGGLVLSHWMLDAIVHLPDLPIYPGHSPKVGLGLWNSFALTIIAEGVLLMVGVFMYVQSKSFQTKKLSWKFWSLVAFLIVIQVMNFIGPPPPSVSMIAWAGQLQWLFILWAWWADK